LINARVPEYLWVNELGVEVALAGGDRDVATGRAASYSRGFCALKRSVAVGLQVVEEWLKAAQGNESAVDEIPCRRL
jgi:hypothetical protein